MQMSSQRVVFFLGRHAGGAALQMHTWGAANTICSLAERADGEPCTE